MKVDIKAGLLSALVLPGIGQIYQGRKLRGGVIIVLVNLFLLGGLALVLRSIGRIAASAAAGTAIDRSLVIQALQQDGTGGRWLLAGFVALWLYSAADAFFGGNGADSRDQ
jgi:hypothetical protein